jgi:hypothetical protein
MRSENLVTIDVASFCKSEQVVVSVGENGDFWTRERGNTIPDKNVLLDSPQNTSGFSTYINQAA